MFMILNIYKGRETFDKMVRDGKFSEAIHLDIDDNFEIFNKKNLDSWLWKNRQKINQKVSWLRYASLCL